MTEQEYCKITSTTGWFHLSYFYFEEVQTFLNGLGYELVVHTGLIKVDFRHQDGDHSHYEQVLREAVLAVKPGTPLPERLDSDEAHQMRVERVFNTEMKQKLLKL